MIILKKIENIAEAYTFIEINSGSGKIVVLKNKPFTITYEFTAINRLSGGKSPVGDLSVRCFGRPETEV